jgi:hypothetical protein
VDLTFTDLRQLAYRAAGLCDIIGVTGFVGLTGELVSAICTFEYPGLGFKRGGISGYQHQAWVR